MLSAGQITNDLNSLRGLGRVALIQLIKKYNLSINIIQYPEGEDDKLRGAIESQLKGMRQRALKEEQSAPPPKRGHLLIWAMGAFVLGVSTVVLCFVLTWWPFNATTETTPTTTKTAVKAEKKSAPAGLPGDEGSAPAKVQPSGKEASLQATAPAEKNPPPARRHRLADRTKR